MNQHTPSFVSHIDSYVYHALQGFTGRMVAVQTARGTVTGLLQSVMPDHLVVESGGAPFFIRTQQIIWVIPRG
jgi:hypothetical protein